MYYVRRKILFFFFSSILPFTGKNNLFGQNDGSKIVTLHHNNKSHCMLTRRRYNSRMEQLLKRADNEFQGSFHDERSGRDLNEAKNIEKKEKLENNYNTINCTNNIQWKLCTEREMKRVFSSHWNASPFEFRFYFI